MNKMQSAVYIKAHLARGVRTKADELAFIGGVVESDFTSPNTRQIIKELIDDGNVIGSNSRGYKMLTTGKEVQQYLNALLKRQLGISRRIQAVYNSARAKGIL